MKNLFLYLPLILLCGCATRFNPTTAVATNHSSVIQNAKYSQTSIFDTVNLLVKDNRELHGMLIAMNNKFNKKIQVLEAENRSNAKLLNDCTIQRDALISKNYP